jgi:uncharacterized membrane protein YbhN (UPF0104 family)
MTHPAARDSLLAKRIGYVIVFAFLGGAVYLGVAIWAGLPAVAEGMARIGAGVLAGGVAATAVSLLLRFARWHLVLRSLAHAPPLGADLRAYLSGLALTTTPGKLGETLRSALLHRFGVPVGTSLAAFFVDRLSDVVGVLALAALTASGVPASANFAGLACIVLGAAWFLRYLASHPGARATVVGAVDRVRLHRLARWIEHGTVGFAALWSPRRVAVYVAFGLAAYGLQAATFAWFAQYAWPGLGFAAAMHVFLVATLAGAASMVPGGLGAMELAVVALLAIDGVPVALGTSLAIAIRAVTLWFAILVGLVCLSTFRGARAPVPHADRLHP